MICHQIIVLQRQHCDYYSRLFLILIIFILGLSTSSHFCLGQIFASSSELDATTEDPFLSCDPPWREFNSKCYFSTDPSLAAPLPAAKQTCKRFGGDLAKPSSKEEDTYIRRILLSYNDTWIGATDNEKKHWLDGTPMLYHNFPDADLAHHKSKRNSSSPEQKQEQFPLCPSHCCGLTTNIHGVWSYSSCDTILNFVCVKTNETIAAFRLSTKKQQAASSTSSSDENSSLNTKTELTTEKVVADDETTKNSNAQADSRLQQESQQVKSHQKKDADTKNTDKNKANYLSSNAMLSWICIASVKLLYFFK